MQHNNPKVALIRLIADVPPEVNLSHLTNGRLIPENQVASLQAQILKLKENKAYYTDLGPDEKRFPKSSFKALETTGQISANKNYTIIEANNRLYAVYTPPIGKGGFGKVKAIQDIQTGTWYAYKIQASSERAARDIIQPELETLGLFGRSTSKLLARKNNKLSAKQNENKDDQSQLDEEEETTKYSFIMPYISGLNLRTYLKTHPYIPAMQLLTMVIQAVAEVKNMHDRGFLHCDIKISNLKYDAIRQIVTLLDYGLTLRFDSSKTDSVKYHDFRGTKKYSAPEIIAHLDDEQFVYSKATDTYSLGVAIQELLGMKIELNDGKKRIQIYDTSPFNLTDNVFYTFIASMTDSNPAMRPHLSEVLQKLTEFRQEFFALTVPIRGIVEFKECIEAMHKPDNQDFYSALRAVDSIYLIDKIEQLNVLLYTELRNQLEAKGVSVENCVYITNDMSMTLEQIYKQEWLKRIDNKSKVPHVCLIQTASIGEEKIPNIELINVATQKGIYRDTLAKSSALVPQALAKNIKNELKKLRSELNSKSPRIALINEAHANIKSAHDKKNLTYFKLQSELNQLENNLKALADKKRLIPRSKAAMAAKFTVIDEVTKLRKQVEESKVDVERPKMKQR